MDSLSQKKKASNMLGYCIKPPSHITIGVTSACNNKCLFCSYHGEDARDNSNVYNLPFMLSMEEFKRITDMAHRGG